MKLYDAMTPNSLRVKVLLAEKGIDVPREPVDVMGGGTRTSEFLKINSVGELPVLELDDGTILTETVAISRYLEGLHPNPSLFGKTPLDLGLIEMWNRRVELHLFHCIGEYARHTIPFFADKVQQIPDYAESMKAESQKVWKWLDQELSDGRPYVAGDDFSIADITAMAAFFVCDICQIKLSAKETHAKRWEQNLRARESFAGQFAAAARD